MRCCMALSLRGHVVPVSDAFPNDVICSPFFYSKISKFNVRYVHIKACTFTCMQAYTPTYPRTHNPLSPLSEDAGRITLGWPSVISTLLNGGGNSDAQSVTTKYNVLTPLHVLEFMSNCERWCQHLVTCEHTLHHGPTGCEWLQGRSWSFLTFYKKQTKKSLCVYIYIFLNQFVDRR